MAVLSDQDRITVAQRIMAELSTARETCGLTKPDLIAAVAAADDWANTNAASFNSALPAAARTTLTAAQKARLLAWVLLRRYEVS